MSFYDIEVKLSYEQFIHQAETSKPYRGSKIPKYPIGNRRYSSRHWIPRVSQLNTPTTEWIKEQPPIDIFYGSRRLGTFYSDDTFEFPDIVSYHGGENQLINSLLPMWIAAKCQYGGMMVHHKNYDNSHPVYQGMRVRLYDGNPVKDYEVQVYSVDRKLTAPLRKQYEQFFKTAGVMLRAMGDEAIYRELKEIVDDKRQRAVDVLDVIDVKDPAGSVMLLTLRYNWADVRSKISWDSHWSFRNFASHSRGGENLLKSIKELFFRDLYQKGLSEGENYLKAKVYKPGQKLGTCTWGHKMFVDGQEVRRIV